MAVRLQTRNTLAEHYCCSLCRMSVVFWISVLFSWSLGICNCTWRVFYTSNTA